MKPCAFVLASFACAVRSSSESTNALERFSPHLPPSTEIIWRASTNNLPEKLWIYRRLAPRPFSALIIAAATNLASITQCPKPSTDPFFVWSDPNPCGMRYSIFSIQPVSSTISFSLPRQKLLAGVLPDEQTVTQRALAYATQFGLEQELVSPNLFYRTNGPGGCGENATDGSCGRGMYLARKLDGVSFFWDGREASEGFSIELGAAGQVRAFSFDWPELQPEEQYATASCDEITACIRAQKILVLPEGEETNYFGRVQDLASAKTLTITRLAPYYMEGIFGETPTRSEEHTSE